MKIHFKTKQLIEIRNRINKVMDSVAVMKAEKDKIQLEIIEEMSEMDLKSFKNDEVTVSKAIKKTMQIVNERELISELKSRGLNDYVREQIDKDLFKGLATELVKKDKALSGTEIKESEYISIRTNKSNK